MRRGDVVTVAASGDYGKPRPAVIVQTDAFPAAHASVVVCQLTSDLTDAPDFRVTIEPSKANGLRLRCRIMADKPVTVRRERIGRAIGRLAPEDIRQLDKALAFVIELADRRVKDFGEDELFHAPLVWGGRKRFQVSFCANPPRPTPT